MGKDTLTEQVIGAAIEVHRELGPGLLESAYENCLRFELEQRGLEVDTQVSLPVQYKGTALDCAYRIDMVVDNQLIIELKTVEKYYRSTKHSY